jgi:hypothetical protein
MGQGGSRSDDESKARDADVEEEDEGSDSGRSNQTLHVLVDDRLMQHRAVVVQNFAGTGVHLYLVHWSDEAAAVDPSRRGRTTSFSGAELARAHPRLVREAEGGYRFVHITHEDLKSYPASKRIYGATFVSGYAARRLLRKKGGDD